MLSNICAKVLYRETLQSKIEVKLSASSTFIMYRAGKVQVILCLILIIVGLKEIRNEDANYYQEYMNTNRESEDFSRNPILELFTNVLYGDAKQNMSSLFDFLRDSYPLPEGRKYPLQEYDFIIIGAGSAGCALASRLSRNKNTTVLLLEAGKPEMILTDIPAVAPFLQSTEYVWPYYMEHQPGVCMGMNNQRCFWPRGKAVGGTSVVNYMIYTRGRPREWDRIAEDGNYGWSYDDILKYYIEMERSNLDGYEKASHRGRDGDLRVNFIPVQTKLLNTFLKAGRELGIPTVDYNAPEVLGFGRLQATLDNGHRYSAAKAFLHGIKNRANLHILPESRVTKILIDDSKTAYGVEYVRNNVQYTVKARKEVILSAGPIASPQLLMLSGIGPMDHLNSMQIPVIHNLPVGRTLYDHITFPGIIFTLNVTNISFIENRIISINNVIKWVSYGEGEFTTVGGAEGIGYIKTSVSDDPDPSVPDIEFICIGGSLVSDGGPGGSRATRRGMQISESIFDNAFGAIDGTDTWSAFPMLLHPKSYGYLELKDKNPFSHPRMYGNYLTDPSDVATFVASIRFLQKLASTTPFQRLGAKIYPAKYKFCTKFDFDSDEYWECAVRTLTATLHHQIATCRMGPDNDPLAIVDPELRVKGINLLRVADSGVLPRTISAHTNAPASVIGLKAASMIKATWHL